MNTTATAPRPFLHADGSLVRCFCPSDCGCQPWTTSRNACGCLQHSA